MHAKRLRIYSKSEFEAEWRKTFRDLSGSPQRTPRSGSSFPGLKTKRRVYEETESGELTVSVWASLEFR